MAGSLEVCESMMRAASAMAAVRRSIEAGGTLTVTLSREVGRLYDPIKGEPVPLEASGVHALGATTLTIAPQATWNFRGSVLSGAVVTITGHPSSYTTTADARVDGSAPDTLALTIPAPGLSSGLSGGEVISIEEAAEVSYTAREISDGLKTPRGWGVTGADVLYLVDYEGKAKPKPGDILSAPIAGSVKNVKGAPFDYCTIHCGGVAA